MGGSVHKGTVTASRYPQKGQWSIMKKLIIIAIAAFLALGGVIGTTVGINNSPKVVAMKAITNAVEDFTKRDEIAPILNAMNGGSLSFKVEGDEMEDIIGSEGKVEVSGKIYMNLDKEAVMLDEFVLDMADISLSGQAYLSRDLLYITNKEILDGTYGLERGSLVKNLRKSVFAPDSDTEYAMSEEDFKTLEEFCELMDDKVDVKMQKDLQKVYERYMKKAWKLVGEYAEFESETDTVRINGDRKKARVITMTLDDKAVSMIAEEMMEYLVDDEDLADMIEEYGDRFAETLKSVYQINDLSEEYDDLLDRIEENMDEVIDSIEASMTEDLVVTIVTPPASSDLLMMSVKYDNSEMIKLEIGHEGIRKTDCITVKIDGSEISYVIEEDSRKTFEAKLMSNNTTVASIEIDRSRDEFELDLGGEFVLEGDWNSKGKETNIVVDTLKIDGERYGDINLELVLNESDRMPSRAKKVVSVFAIDEEDVEAWGERINDMLGVGGWLSGSYIYESSYGEQTFTFRGNRFELVMDTFGYTDTREGTYEIYTNNGKTMIRLDYDGYSEDTYSFEKGSNYILINGIKYYKN